MKRSAPPKKLFEISADSISLYLPAPRLERWFRATFIEPGGPLYNPDHEHLQVATIGAIWTNEANTRQMRQIVGQAQMGAPQSSQGKWQRGMQEQQLRLWFGCVPDFKMILYAPYALEASDLSFCALVEHELYHFGQKIDEFGCPKFKQDGSPSFGLRGHDVEEFVGVIRRYGVGAGAGDTRALVEAATRPPLIGEAAASAACGTCGAGLG